MTARAWISTIVISASVAAVSCGSTISAYARLDAAAARAYSAGRYDEASARWEEAARAAQLPENRSEARYLAAASLLRAGRRAEGIAKLEKLLTDDPTGPRAARAAHDRALAIIASGETDRGYEALELTFRTYPDSGLAPVELRQYAAWLESRDEGSSQRYLEGLMPRLQGKELAEHAGYALAEALERAGKLEAARDRYLETARRFPYPHGALWDDALWHAADLEAKLGNARTAIAHLERMLSQRETAYMTGSYERARYAQARFRIAELYRDALRDPLAARAAFEKLLREHKTSRLRDDAAWNAALLALRSGDRKGACGDLRALVAATPDSRYAPCASRLCPEVKASGECHEYLMNGPEHP